MSGKDSARSFRKKKDDEDKGSPSQDGAKDAIASQNRQISGSPSGAPSPVPSFPPKINFAKEHRLSNGTDRVAEIGKYHCRCERIAQ